MAILEKMGIFGWKEEDENLLVASILTGDPLLLIGRHGSSKKTYLHSHSFQSTHSLMPLRL